MELVEQAKEQFRLLDADNSGFLEKNELEPIVHKWANANATSLKLQGPDVVDRILAQLDVDQDGKVSLLEFIDGFDTVMYEKKKEDAKVHVIQDIAKADA